MRKPTIQMTSVQKQVRAAFDRGVVRGREDALRDILFELHNESAMLFAKLRDAESRLMELAGR